MVELILRLEGYLAIGCLHSTDVHTLIQRERPGVIMLDIGMETPEAGWQVVEELRSDPATCAIPIIVSTGDVRFLRQRERQLHAYGGGILTKLYGLDALVAVIDAQVLSSQERTIGG